MESLKLYEYDVAVRLLFLGYPELHETVTIQETDEETARITAYNQLRAKYPTSVYGSAEIAACRELTEAGPTP